MFIDFLYLWKGNGLYPASDNGAMQGTVVAIVEKGEF